MNFLIFEKYLLTELPYFMIINDEKLEEEKYFWHFELCVELTITILGVCEVIGAWKFTIYNFQNFC